MYGTSVLACRKTQEMLISILTQKTKKLDALQNHSFITKREKELRT